MFEVIQEAMVFLFVRLLLLVATRLQLAPLIRGCSWADKVFVRTRKHNEDISREGCPYRGVLTG